MSIPPVPSSPDAEIIGNDGWGVRVPVEPLTVDRSQMPAIATAVGVALLSAAAVVSTMFSRETGDLDVSTFAVGVLATLGLLGIAAAAQLLLAVSEKHAALVSWPGAAGAISAGLLSAVLLNDDDRSIYLGASVTIVIAVAGYLLSRAGAFVLAGIAGLAVLYGKVFDDVIDTDGDGGNTFMIIGAGVLVFVVVVTAVGWMLPETRVLIGIVVGIGGVAGFAMIFQFLTISRYFGDFPEDEGFGGPSPLEVDNPYINDIWATLGYCAVLAAFWIGCALVTGHIGFRILVVAIAVLAVPLTAFSLATTHPTWWEVALCAVGGMVLLSAAYAAQTAGNAGPAVEAPAPPAGS